MVADNQLMGGLRRILGQGRGLISHRAVSRQFGMAAASESQQTEVSLTAQPDRAARSLAEDRLGRKPFVDRLVGALIDEQTGRATGVVVGIVGEWGSGKSSILNMLDGAIHDAYPDNALVIRFDPWLVSGRDDLISQFLQQLQATIAQRGKLKQRLKELVSVLQKYGQAVAPVANAGWPGLKAAFDVMEKLGSTKRSLHDQRALIANLLSKIEIPIVVLIDELDRVDDEEVHAVAQLVRSVMDFPRISYVLAYDGERVAEALGGSERGQAYLEKIVQFPIPLPLATGAEIRRMFEAQLTPIFEDVGIDPALVDRERYAELIKHLIPGILKTPRDIKRVLGMYHVLSGMVWEEVDNIDLLAFTAVMSKAPQTEKLIRNNYQLYIQDGWRDEDYAAYFDEAQQELEDRLKAKIAEDERSPNLDRLMGFLFPQLSPDRREDAASAHSLCYYSPLLTVLRLGLLPGDYPSSEIRALLAKPAIEILEFMKAVIQTDDFGNFWLRLRDVYLSDDFDDAVHQTFWEAMRLFVLKYDNQWPTQYPAMRDVVGNIDDLFDERFFVEDKNIQELGKTILDDLFEMGDVEILPFILRRHFFFYGLFGWAQKPVGPVFLSENQTKELAERVAAREVDRLVGGDLLKSLWVPHVIFLIKDVPGELDEASRAYFDGLVQDDESLPAICLFFSTPKTFSDAQTLGLFFDLDALKERVLRKLASDESDEQPLDPSVRVSYRKIIDHL